MLKRETLLWIPLWVDKWIFGSTRIELTPEQRAIWIDFLALAAKDQGFIRANSTTPYLATQLAGLLNVTVDALMAAVARFVETGKIHDDSGIFYILNWEAFQFSKRYQREVAQAKTQEMLDLESQRRDAAAQRPEPALIRKDKIGKDRIGKDIFRAVVEHLNRVTGKRFKENSKIIRGLIQARMAEGWALEDFIYVVDVKAARWLGDENMRLYLRPETLFSRAHFESYRNEEKPKPPVGDQRKPPTEKEKEYKRQAAQARAELIKLGRSEDEIKVEMVKFSERFWGK